MNLYKVSQDEVRGYDTFSDMVVCAHNEGMAASIHPYDSLYTAGDNWTEESTSWCSTPALAHVEYLGVASADLESGVICASYHVG